MSDRVDRAQSSPAEAAAGGTAPGPVTKAGYVTLVGRPNAGKSTLLNALVGETLSIVTPKAQTTWERVTGIRSDERAQYVFLDTPGLLEVRDLHQRAMLAAARTALEDADVVLVIIDATRPLEELRRDVVTDSLALSGAPRVVAINKVDAATPEAVQAAKAWVRDELGGEPVEISAIEGTGLERLLEVLRSALPESPFLFDADDLATQPVRFFVAELVRETVFEQYEQEIPYAVAAQVEEFREDRDPVYIGVSLFVEQKSQKGIMIGHKGQAIRSLGMAARQKIETFLGRPVYLDLWVKPLQGWRRKRGHLARLGYRVPEDPA